MRTTSLRQFSLLCGIGGLLALSAQYACTDSDCKTIERAPAYQTVEAIDAHAVETLDAALARQGRTLSAAQAGALSRDGHLFGVASLDRPIKHPDGLIEMPAGWLPPIPDGHPWARTLTPTDDAFYSWFEERVLEARLFDPQSPQHVAWATAYLAKGRTDGTFQGWTYAASTACPK